MLGARHFVRATEKAQGIRTASLASRSKLSRRLYSNGKEPNESKSSNSRWLLGSIGLGGSLTAYLLWARPKKSSEHRTHGPGWGNPEDETAGAVEKSPPGSLVGQPKEESKATQVAAEKTAEAKSQGQETARVKPELQDIPPSEVDEARAMKSSGGSGTMSGKQEGISNADTSHPFLTTPEKSRKKEGDTETSKLKGTVSTER